MDTVKLPWPTSTNYSRTAVTLPADGVILEFTVPAGEQPRSGSIQIDGGINQRMHAVLSETPGGPALNAAVDLGKPPRAVSTPRLPFMVGKADPAKYAPTLAAGKTYYATVSNVNAPGKAFVDLNAGG